VNVKNVINEGTGLHGKAKILDPTGTGNLNP
jgi:hypothetical protein